METLGAGRPLLVVVNDKLMDNHQLELARQLHMDSHLLYCTCRYVFLTYIVYINATKVTHSLFGFFNLPAPWQKHWGPWTSLFSSPSFPDSRSILQTSLTKLSAFSETLISQDCLFYVTLKFDDVSVDCDTRFSHWSFFLFLYVMIIYLLISHPHVCCEFLSFSLDLAFLVKVFYAGERKRKTSPAWGVWVEHAAVQRVEGSAALWDGTKASLLQSSNDKEPLSLQNQS